MSRRRQSADRLPFDTFRIEGAPRPQMPSTS